MTNVLVLSRHRGPLDRRIVAEVNTLAASGRVVTLVSVPAVIPSACLDRRVRVVMPPGGGVAKGQHLQEAARRLPFRVRMLARAAWYTLSRGPVPSSVQYFMQMTPQETFDVIHCHDLDTLPAAVALRHRLSPGAKLIYDSHELFPFQFQDRTWQRYWSRVEAEYIRAADLIITVNTSIAEELARRYSIPPPAVIYNSYGSFNSISPVDEKGFLAHFGAEAAGFRVLFQGSLVREKNLDTLVKAFQRLQTSVQLFMLGGGPFEAHLKRLCSKLGIANVFFGSWVPQEELLGYVAHADLGIIPYSGNGILNNRYCTPNKLFEFIEAEIPICASDLPELRRIITGHGIGTVDAMENPEAMAMAIEACRVRCVRGEFTKAALHTARETFAWEGQGRKLLQLYEKLGV